ncbi:MAG: RES domain-containing protein [Bacteroidia bacterium]
MGYFPKIKSKLENYNFRIPITQSAVGYFPDFLETELNNYTSFYQANIKSEIENKIPIRGNIANHIQILSTAIIDSVNKYYEGNILEATNIFNEGLSKIFIDGLDMLTTIEENASFYRARKNDNATFSKEDLFHIKFEHRHIVSTNRFSVPGFPALYLGDSTYTCWEEFNRYRLRDLYFSRLENKRQLKVIYIEKYSDFLETLDKENDSDLDKILRYLVLYPLIIACSVRTQNPNGNFKPEYIIPQLLLQFVSKESNIDGIKFPSTRIDYSKLSGISGYNYVFPVKKIAKKGFCETLIKTFFITEPTSLELEEIIFNPVRGISFANPENKEKKIELINGTKSSYNDTSFGKIEFRLSRREMSSL